MIQEIYDIVQELKDLDAMPDEEKSEEVYRDTWNMLQGDFEENADKLAKWRAVVKGRIEATQKEYDRLGDKLKSDKNTVAFIEKTLESVMREVGKTKFKTDLFSYGIQKNGGKPSLKYQEGIMPIDVPKQYTRQPALEFDGDAIRKALDAGEKLDWVHAERGEGLRIR